MDRQENRAAAPMAADGLDEMYEDRTMGKIAQAMPWVLSGLFHVGLFLVMMFLAMFITPADAKVQAYTADSASLTAPEKMSLPTQASSSPRAKASAPHRSSSRQPVEALAANSGRTSRKLSDMVGRASGPTGLDVDGPVGSDVDGDPFPKPLPGAYNVVYVVDRSGSMLESFDDVRWAMLDSIGRLGKERYFHVILFAQHKPLENGPRRLVRADGPNRKQAYRFLLEVRPHGQTDPVPAIERAFAVLRNARKRGKIIHLLTDGRFSDNEKVFATIAKLNHDKSVRINTTLYGNRPPEADQTLRKIAKENGGQYRFVAQE
jgi:hypothetical protein